MSASEYGVDKLDAGPDLALFPHQQVTVTEPATGVPRLALAPPPVPLPALPYHGWRRVLKRLIDVTVTLAVMPGALPLMAVLAIAVRCSSRGPAIFRQDRVGQFGKVIRVLKFRTMHVDADRHLRADPQLYAEYVANDYKLPTGIDPRVTRLGRFLRRTSLDELPQLFNVLGGSMSLVGPRPIIREELPRYGDAVASYLQMRPGLTGRWQLDGRNLVRYPERAYLDHDYLQTWRLSTDLVILMRTVPSVLRRRGCQ
ncbi:MAG: sugar transferase [Acidimicrobiales bacterium]